MKASVEKKYYPLPLTMVNVEKKQGHMPLDPRAYYNQFSRTLPGANLALSEIRGDKAHFSHYESGSIQRIQKGFLRDGIVAATLLAATIMGAEIVNSITSKGNQFQSEVVEKSPDATPEEHIIFQAPQYSPTKTLPFQPLKLTLDH